MQITTKTATFDGDDVNSRIDQLIEDNGEGSCSKAEMDELVGLLHFRNDNSDGSGWSSRWGGTDYVSENATSVLAERIRQAAEDEHEGVDFDESPFKHINWVVAIEDEKNSLDEVILTIGGETGTFFVFDNS